MNKRYEIQIANLTDTLTGEPVQWRTFYSARACHTLKGARKEWWEWVSKDWDFVADRPLFRIWDRKKEKTVT